MADSEARAGGARAGGAPGDAATDALARITARLTGAEERAGQRAMAAAVEETLRRGGTLLVEAGTGTGKSLGYLVPAVQSHRRPVIVATATKALQDQLLDNEIPSIRSGLDRPVEAVAVKGRSAYLCRAKEAEVRGRLETADRPEMTALLEWAASTGTGDMAELDPTPPPALWGELSVGGMECPGAQRCRHGEHCLSEAARIAAEEADVVVVNHAVLAYDLAVRAEGGAGFLPDAGAIVLDEAHRVEESLTNALGLDLSLGRARYVAAMGRGLLVDQSAPNALESAAGAFFTALGEHAGARMSPEIKTALSVEGVALAQAVSRLSDQVRGVPESAGDRKIRLQRLLGHFAVDFEIALSDRDDGVSWIEADRGLGRLRSAPLDIAPFANTALFDGSAPVVLTSATLSFAGSFEHLRRRLGIPDATELRVDSPFDFRAQGLLYCARHLPDPREPGFDEAARQETRALLEASGGRAFCLYTSWRAMQAASDALGPELPWTVLRQGEAAPGRLVARMQEEAPAVLFATVSFWQGVDLPGDALQLVVLDRLPFASPGDPLAAARVDAVRQAGGDWFADEVLPRAGLLLAQGVGRLIRRRDDRGVVAVLDRRLATAGYRTALLASLPPLRRSVSLDDVRTFFASLREGHELPGN